MAGECVFSLEVSDPAATGFDYAAEAAALEALALNGCDPAPPEATDSIHIQIAILDLKAGKKINTLGLLLGGGGSSALAIKAAATLSIRAQRGGEEIFALTTIFRPPVQELFNGFRRARSIKKHAVENAAIRLVLGLVRELMGEGFEPIAPLPTNGDMMNRDRDVWPLLGGFLIDLTLHEMGHATMARITGHNAEIRGNDTRNTTIGAHIVGGLSLLFAHHWGEHQIMTFLPDVFYDFAPTTTANGIRYLYEDGGRVPCGRRNHALASYGGILAQNLTNEYILTRYPNLIDEDRSLMKGMFLFNILIPSVYTFTGWDDPNSDLTLLGIDMDADQWAVNALVLTPAAIDVYRYYHPEKKKLKFWSRLAKVLPVLIILGQNM